MRHSHSALGLLAASAAAFVPLAVTAQNAAVQGSNRVAVREAAFESEGVTLRGDFFTPEDRSPGAGIVLVHGSGRVPRMDDFGRIFANRGMAVLTYDKRGVGESGGEYEGVYNVSPENLALLASDAAAGMRWLAARPGMENVPLGYWGISQAGWIIPLAAIETSEADFITLWSGPVCTASEELEDGLRNGESAGNEAVLEDFIDALRSTGTDPDPRVPLRQLDIPALWIFGSEDREIPVRLSIERLQGLIADGQAHFEYRLNDGGGHNLDLRRDRAVFDAMVDWMLTREDVSK